MPLRKFVDGLPGLTAAGANNLGQYLPVAVADTTSYPGSDYYEIGIVEYTEKMHSDLPKATTLRGYVQLETAANAAVSKHVPLTYPNGAPIVDANGSQIFAVDAPHYLGPVISANRGVPVRFKYSNLLPVGQYDPITKSRGGDIFLPVDKTIVGAGAGPVANNNYTQNRAEIHLHGGDSPWISDGTPHQWITPAGENTPYPKGVSFQNVPDMPDPGAGSGTLYYPNDLSARLMFYHDHTFGITRVNVYAGEAAGYLISDPVEQGLVSRGIIPVDQIPLIIQDKTFVPMDIAQQDAYWDTAAWGQPGDLWYPHVYEPNQSLTALGGLNPVGRWDYGPWAWPVFPAPLALPSGAYPNPSTTPEAFMDTPVVNGTAYPTLTVQPKAYRFRILNAANDRFANLGLYVAADKKTISTATPAMCDGLTPVPTGDCTEVKMIPAALPTATMPLCSTVGAINDATTGLPVGSGTSCWPDTWPTDARAGGVPDPLTAGPKMIQIGSEGGFLPKPHEIPATLIGYDALTASVSTHGLYMGPAERADVIIDFSQYAGKTLILYSDAPTPVPGADPRYDYYTGDPDQSGIGGAFSTLPGYGPNTRTIMQITVANVAPAAPFNAAPLPAELLTAYTASQPRPIAAETAYNGTAAPVVPTDTYAGLEVGSSLMPTFDFVTGDALTYQPYDPVTKTVLPTLKTVAAGTAVTDFPVQNKAIMEQFDPNYGRLNATLGVALPFSSSLTRTALALSYVDPATESIADGETQIWKITHNGVDTHPVHFHLVNVQVINRVGWNGTVMPPQPYELGWKETVKMNPLEDIIVAVRAKAPATPFGMPDSVRAEDPAQPLGVTTGFTQVDPLSGLLKTVANSSVSFGWEYVWHCHILGHEENDFMRPLIFKYTAMSSAAPSNLTVNAGILNWTDPTPAGAVATLGNQANEISFKIQRSTDGVTFTQIGTTLANTTSFTDTTTVPGTTYTYRVIAANAVGDSLPSNAATITTAIPISGIVADGPILGAMIYIDANRNGIADAGELVPGVTTDGSGWFTGSTSLRGPIMAVGGTDTVTMAANTLQLEAPEGSSYINPVTTIVNRHMRANPGETLAAAETIVKNNFGLTIASLTNVDPATDLPTQKVIAEIGTIASMSNSSDVVLNNITARMNAAPTAPLDLASPAEISAATAGCPAVAANLQLTANISTAIASIKAATVVGDIALAQSTAATTKATADAAAVSNALLAATDTKNQLLAAQKEAGLANTSKLNAQKAQGLVAGGLAAVMAAVDPATANLAVSKAVTDAASALTESQAAATHATAALTASNAAALRSTDAGTAAAQVPTDVGAKAAASQAALDATAAKASSDQAALDATAAKAASDQAALDLQSAQTAAQTLANNAAVSNALLAATDTKNQLLAAQNEAGLTNTSKLNAVAAQGLVKAGLAAVMAAVDPVTANLAVTKAVTDAATALTESQAAGTHAAAALKASSTAALRSTDAGTAAAQVPTDVNAKAAASQAALDATAAKASSDQAALDATAAKAASDQAALDLQSAKAAALATVGNGTGGNATGGNATGGNATGGNATGGNGTGGNGTGGNATSGNGTGAGPSSALSSNAPINFPPLKLGTTSAAWPVTLSNTGGLPLSISRIGIGGKNPYQFAHNHNCGNSLAVGKSCTINVVFKPTNPGDKSATLDVSDATGTKTIVLSGTGVALSSSMTPNQLAFTAQTVGSVSLEQAVTLINTGGLPLPIQSIKIGGKNPYQFAHNHNCGNSLAVGKSCTINVAFKPTNRGDKSATLDVSDATGTKKIVLSGTGVALSSSMTPNQLAFTAQTVGSVSLEQAVTLINTGGLPLPIQSIKIGGKNPYQFAHSHNCGNSLAVGTSCTINVVSKPTSRGSKSATLEVVDATGTRKIVLSGNGK